MVVTSLSRLLVCVLALVRINLGGYVVTTPQRWTLGGRSHVCVVVTEPHHSPGHLTLTLNDTKNVDLTPLATLHLPPGRWSTCEEVEVGEGEQYHGKLRVEGLLGGEKVDHTATLSLVTSRSVTFIQTDKYYYQPGHTVHFRILTLHSAFLNVSTNTYPEVWVETPSRTRVAQWRDVDNAPGLVHLAMALADEPQQGVYTIFVRTEEDKSHSTTFMVEQYVLPRFQVTIVPPEYLLLTHTSFFFTVCARYTFGQSVRGEVRLEVSNGLHRNCRVLVIKEALILGCQNVGVEAREVLLEECGVYRVTVQATVTEDGTGVQQAGRGHVTVSSQPVVFTTVYSDQFMKPNLPFTIKVRGELPDGTPAPGVALEMCAAGVCTNTTTSQDGSVTAVLPSYTTNRFFLKTLGCSARVQSSLYNLQVHHYVSPSNSSLMIYAPDTRLKCDPGAALRHYLPVMFSATNTTRVSLNVQVVSRGLVQYWKTEEYQMNPGVLPISVEHLVGALSPPPPHTVRGVLHVPLTLPHTASPTVKVLMWYTREDGEVVSDARDLEVERCLGSEVRLEWREDSTQPGALTALSLSSRPHSLCSLGVVDRSTELLSTREDPITLEKIFDFVNTYEIYPWGFRPGPCENQETAFSGDASLRVQPLLGFPPYPVFSEYVDAAFMFHTAGLLVFSDLRLVAAPCDSPELFGNIKDVNNPVLEMSTSGGGDEGLVDARTSFPETWLFDLLLLPSSGVTRQEVRAPDTITQWVGKAVCVSPDHHVGVSLRANLTTFTPFFLDLTLPPSVKRGEILPVKISIFNYLDRPLPVRVRMEERSEFKLVGEEGEEVAGERSVCVAAQDKKVVTVKLDMLALGDIKIGVSAFVDQQIPLLCGSRDDSIKRRDALVKPIKVEPEGFPRERTWTSYLCSQGPERVSGGEVVWEVEVPGTMVERSARAWVTVVADLLGLSLQHLGSLISMPSGCGEQNLITFAPNIFILQYLRATGQDTPELTDKLLRFMNTGYQRQLLYLRDDGSFSVFGRADASGSTWLTAFVLKSFAQAQTFILVDESVLRKSRSWLGKKQGKDGCFLALGKVLHKHMKGGIVGKDSPVPLTAYVMISLMEAGEELHSPVVLSAAGCLAVDSSHHPYTLALKAYALALARLPTAQVALQLLLDQAVVTPDFMYWELPSRYGRSRAAEVETASYVILSMITLNAECFFQQATKIVQWITAQRNSRGGFSSTQDTVVALQALATYETHFYQGPVSVEARVTAAFLSLTFTVNESNKLLEQRVTLPVIPTTVRIGVGGQGCAVLQAVLRYNVPHPEPSDAFSLTVTTKVDRDPGCVTQSISACAAYHLADAVSNMAVIEVNLVSGYVPINPETPRLTNDTARRYEVEGSKIFIYLEELTERETCVVVRVRREIVVENVKPSAVVVYDYYQPQFSVSQDYRLVAPEDCV